MQMDQWKDIKLLKGFHKELDKTIMGHYDETLCPVVQFESIHSIIAMAMAAQNGMLLQNGCYISFFQK